MPTTSIRPGHSVSGVLNNLEWGEGYTAGQRAALDAALIEKFEELARERTGDESISYCPYTSEIMYECHGQTTAEHHCLSALTPHDATNDWGELANEASVWAAENAETIIDGID